MAKTNGNGHEKAELNTAIATKDEASLENFFADSPEAAELVKAGFASETTILPEVGVKFSALYLGPGADVEKTNQLTGEVQYLPAFRMQAVKIAPGSTSENFKYEAFPLIVRVISSYNLTSFLRALTPGNTIVICHMKGKKQVGTKQVNDWDCWSKVIPELRATGPALSDVQSKERREAQAQAQATA